MMFRIKSMSMMQMRLDLMVIRTFDLFFKFSDGLMLCALRIWQIPLFVVQCWRVFAPVNVMQLEVFLVPLLLHSIHLMVMMYRFRLVLGMVIVVLVVVFWNFRDNNMFFNWPVEVGRNVGVRVIMLRMWRMVMLAQVVVIILGPL